MGHPSFERPDFSAGCYKLVNARFHGATAFQEILALCSICFAVYLLTGLRSASRRIKSSESLVLPIYYSFVWGVCFFNLVRVAIDMAASGLSFYAGAALYLLTRFGLLFIELSVLIFIMAPKDLATGRENMQRTAKTAAVGAGVYTLIVGVWIVGMRVPYLSDVSGRPAGYYLALSLLFTVGYLLLLLAPRKSRLGKNIRARASYRRYLLFLFALNLLLSIGTLLLMVESDVGFCFLGSSWLAYFGFYAPLIYILFVRVLVSEPPVSSVYLRMMEQGSFGTDI